jgi:alkaline phosphatase D
VLLVALTGAARQAVRAQDSGFSLGVAAGDVTADRAVLWTRADDPGELVLRVARDVNLSESLQTATIAARDEHDRTVKVDIAGLSPDASYYYRFERVDDPSRASRLGRFRTAPPPDAARPLRFSFSGDSNFARAPFGLLHSVARDEPDFFIWFGDTMYADLPAGELRVATTLDEYRAKYRQVRGDAYVRDLLASAALWTGWDDHEVLNDYAGLDPALPPARRDAAYQAFFEYMPIRPQTAPDDPYRTYRRVRYGALAEFFFLDNRQYRDPSALEGCAGRIDPLGLLFGQLTADRACADLLAAPRTMLGAAQRDWLLTGLAQSTARHKFVVDSVVFSRLGVYPYDRWDGYDAERRILFEAIDAGRIEGVTFLSTDIHASLHAPDLSRPFRRAGYSLPNGVRWSEVTTGPIAMATFLEEAIAGGAELSGLPDSLLAGAAGGLKTLLRARLRHDSGIAAFEPDKYSYARIEVGPDLATVSLRGIAPREPRATDPAQPGADVTTFYSAPLIGPAPGAPCAAPLLAMALAGAGLMARARALAGRHTGHRLVKTPAPCSDTRRPDTRARLERPRAQDRHAQDARDEDPRGLHAARVGPGGAAPAGGRSRVSAGFDGGADRGPRP